MMDAETRARKLHHQRELSAIKKAERREHLASRPAKVATGGGKLSGEAGEATPRRAISLSRRRSVILRYKNHCGYCGLRFLSEDAVEIDHIVPLELGGADEFLNLAPLHPPCHKLKTREDVRRIAKAKRQSKLLQPREPSKHPIRSRGFS